MDNSAGSVTLEIRATREKLKQDLDAAKREAADFGQQVERGVDARGRGIGASISRMTTGAMVGLTALTGAIALVATGLFRIGVESFQMADRMADSAKSIGISTQALQEWGYVARKSGSDAKSAADAIEAFADKYRGAASGLSKPDVKLFEALEIGQEELRSLGGVEQALGLVVSRIGELKSEAEQLAIIDKLGLEPLSEGLIKGAAEIDRLRREAVSLGFTIDAELIDKAAEVNGKFESMSDIIGIQMASAFISLSDEILAFTGHVANALKGLNEFIGKYQSWSDRQDAIHGPGYTNKLLYTDFAGAMGMEVRSLTSGRQGRVREALDNPEIDQDDPAMLREQMAVAGADAPAVRDRPRNRTLADTTSPSRNRDAERRAAEALRNQRRYEDALADLAQDQLQAQQAFTTTAEERASNAIMALDMEREETTRSLDRQVADGDLTATRRDQIKAAQDLVFSTQAAVIAQDLETDQVEERAELNRQFADFAAALLGAESQLATSSGDRLKVELDLLEIKQEERRRALEQAASDETLSTAKREAARLALEQLGYLEGLEKKAVERQNASPLQRYRDQSLSEVGRMNDAMESIAVDALDRLNDGLVDAIMNSKSLGDVFSNVARQIVADLLAISIKRSITEPLADALFPKAGATSGGGIITSIGRMFGFAGGGHVQGHGTGTSDSIVARLSNGEFVVRAEQTKKYRSLLEAINMDALPKFAMGGLVDPNWGFASEDGGEMMVQGDPSVGVIR